MNEMQAFALAQAARRLHALISRIEDDYRIIADTPFVNDPGGITEFRSIPVFLDLAEEIAGKVKALAEVALSEFD